MSKNYDDYKPINPMPPRKRRNPMLSFVQYSIIILLVLALIAAGAFFMVLHNDSDHGATPSDPIETFPTDDPIDQEPVAPSAPEIDELETDDSEIGDHEPIEPIEPDINTEGYTEMQVSKDDIHKGDLIFVSSNYKVVYPTDDELVFLKDKKTTSYKISNNTMTVNGNIIENTNKMFDSFKAATDKSDLTVWSSYRNEEAQSKIYNNYVAKHGEAAAETAVSKPGESDHNTGLGIGLKVFTNGLSYQLSELDGYDWIKENCYKYGFVERYPDDKIEKTGIDYSSDYYIRYVGIPHAEIMKFNNYCLEEYLTVIKDYTFDTTHYDYTAKDGTEYEIYYVSADSEDESVNIPVPTDKEYTLSGDNMSGFIVTVKN